MANKKIPLPKPDPRSETKGLMHPTMPPQGTPQNVDDHPAHSVPEATQPNWGSQLGTYMNALGPKAIYSLETGQMNQAVGVSAAVPRGDE